MNSLLQKFNSLNGKQKNFVVFAVFAILVVTFYGNTLGNGFVSDDMGQIQNNEYIRSLTYLPDAFTGRMIERLYAGYDLPVTYRPLYFMSAIFTYQISSSPWAFHLVNLVYFFIISSLVYLLIKLLTKNTLLSCLTASLFIIHPIQNGVINYASAIPELLLAIFVLLTVIFFILFRKTGSTKKLVLVYICYFFAMTAKEPGVFLPAILLALDALFFKKKIRDIFHWQALKYYALFIVPVILYLIARQGFFGGGNQYGQLSILERMNASTRLFGQYIQKIFFPYPLSISYTFEKSGDLFTFPFLSSLAVVFLFVGVFFFLVQKRKNLFVFFLFWFVAFLLPVLIFYGGRSDEFFAERYLFLPSVGFSFIIASIVSYALNYSQNVRRVAIGVLFVVFGASWVVVFSTNRDWKDNLTLYSASIEKNPKAHLFRWRIAEIALERGDVEGAREQYEYLITNVPSWDQITMAHKGMGDYWRMQGDLDKALEHYIQSTQTAPMTPRDFVPFNDVGMIYLDHKQDPLTGLTYFCQSLSLFPTEQTQQNFDKVLDIINEQRTANGEQLPFLREKFTLVEQENIQYLDRRCIEDSCQFAFGLNPLNTDVILPMLITARSEDPSFAKAMADKQGARSEDVEITNSSFDPAQSVIILETEAKYEDEALTFIFPTCSRTYYEVTTSNE